MARARATFNADRDGAVVRCGILRLEFSAEEAEALDRCLQDAGTFEDRSREFLCELRTRADLPPASVWEVTSAPGDALSLRALRGPVARGYELLLDYADVTYEGG